MELKELLYIGGGIATTLTAYFLARQRVNNEFKSKETLTSNDFIKAEFERLTARIEIVEGKYQECVARETKAAQERIAADAAMQREIGKLTGEVAALKIAVEQGRSADMKTATKLAAAQAVSTAAEKIDAKVEQAVKEVVKANNHTGKE